ncbi:MAG: amino acid racemase [Anaerovoracaceae bacterium]
MRDKLLGVIGGMGPLATQLFYKMIIEKTNAHKDQEHIDMIILNHASMPDRTKAIFDGAEDELLEHLEEDADFLEKGGAEYVAIPCNTCHVLVDRLQNKTDLKIINMINVTVDHVKALYGSGCKVGIMATDGTVKMGLYQKECEAKGLVPIIPSTANQKIVMKIIYEGIKDGSPIDLSEFKKVEDQFRKEDCDCVIMACTELSCFKEMYNLPEYFVDAMEVMACKAITLCGKKIKETKNDQ